MTAANMADTAAEVAVGTTAPLLSIVVPAYCEGEHLESSLAAIHAAAEELGERFEIVVIDDGSKDDTWAAFKRASARLPGLRGSALTRNFGKEAAISAGLRMAGGAAVVVMDGDLQHPPALLPEMLRLWRGGAKIVSAVKQENGRVGPKPWSLSGLFYRSFSRLAGTELAGQSDYKLLDREVVDAYLALPERGTFFRALVPWMGYPEARIPFSVPARVAGESKWSFWRLFRLACDAILSFSTVPLQLITGLGLLTLLFSVVLGAQTLWEKLAGEAVEGFATVILLLLICNGVLMVSLGGLGLYVAKIYEEVKGRPRYLVRESVGTAAAGSASQPASLPAPPSAPPGAERRALASSEALERR